MTASLAHPATYSKESITIFQRILGLVPNSREYKPNVAMVPYEEVQIGLFLMIIREVLILTLSIFIAPKEWISLYIPREGMD